MDLSGWQAIYERLKDKNFIIIAAAQDSGGAKVAAKFYTRAKATYVGLIDVKHTISSLYQMVNVPAGVWIDEQGKIVRPAEVAYSKGFNFLGKKIGDPRYAKGLIDWVEKGEKSIYVMSKEKLAKRLARRKPALRQADAQFKLGVYFYEQGKPALAKQHWLVAQKLNPDSWNYHRQAWSFSRTDAMFKFMRKVATLGKKPYYRPLDWPEEK